MPVVWNRVAAVKGMKSRLIKYNLGSFYRRTCCWTECGVKEKEESKIHDFKISALNKQEYGSLPAWGSLEHKWV